jgi:hypothetical protein
MSGMALPVADHPFPFGIVVPVFEMTRGISLATHREDHPLAGLV